MAARNAEAIEAGEDFVDYGEKIAGPAVSPGATAAAKILTILASDRDVCPSFLVYRYF